MPTTWPGPMPWHAPMKRRRMIWPARIPRCATANSHAPAACNAHGHGVRRRRCPCLRQSRGIRRSLLCADPTACADHMACAGRVSCADGHGVRGHCLRRRHGICRPHGLPTLCPARTFAGFSVAARGQSARSWRAGAGGRTKVRAEAVRRLCDSNRLHCTSGAPPRFQLQDRRLGLRLRDQSARRALASRRAACMQ